MVVMSTREFGRNKTKAWQLLHTGEAIKITRYRKVIAVMVPQPALMEGAVPDRRFSHDPNYSVAKI